MSVNACGEFINRSQFNLRQPWIITFAGSGNPRYSTYLLETYCNFKWEFTPAYRELRLNNWLVNLHGKPGRFIERDLMQEHNNFWLEDLAQHKGSEFDDKYYRNILSMHVHHFLRLKESMEERVSLKARGKKHGAPHLNNELRAMMGVLRDNEVLLRRPGRHEGFEAVDDFRTGLQALRDGKLKDFITRTTTNIDVLGYANAKATLPTDMQVDTEDGRDEQEVGEGTLKRSEPPAAISVENGCLYIPE